ncbi:MAG: Pyruvate/Phosphoenolpyruvate kinase domain protein [Thermoleophilia bacterium]|nr:Pyruvate/Phosphoenolpyruvate kinase domain protein [Thermoleophilia bacterium]
MESTTITPTLGADDLDGILGRLANGNERFAAAFPGESEARQPVHTVYGGAQLFKSGSTVRMGELALASLERYAPNGSVLAEALGWTGRAASQADVVHERVVEKLRREAVEDFRIDFEDGYGNRPDDEEDAEAARTAREVAAGMQAGTLPPFVGIRVKPFSAELHRRGLRTLDIFVSTLVEATGGKLPDGFVVTIPKVVIPEQAAAANEALGALEAKLGLATDSIPMELMVETPQSIIDVDGRIALPALVACAGPRCRGVHFGTYDYTALVGVTAALQAMDHPACSFARHVMQVSMAQRGYLISDGATNIMPVGPNRGSDLAPELEQQNRDVVWGAWRTAHGHIRQSLERAVYQGWDLHPAQLPIRYATVFGFFLEGLEAATDRLSSFIDKAGQATLLGDVFDDAATGQGLLNSFLRALNSGAITEAEATATGITIEEFRGRSFLKIVESRRHA